jgi:hypothetical protein
MMSVLTYFDLLDIPDQTTIRIEHDASLEAWIEANIESGEAQAYYRELEAMARHFIATYE